MRARIDRRIIDELVLKTIKLRLGKQPGRLALGEIAQEMRCSKDAVRRSVRRLNEQGFITCEVGGGYGKPSMYQVKNRPRPD